jgi:succinate-semialdehyde dehydrogenase/glutarate-semialdehyde dehydrogenase
LCWNEGEDTAIAIASINPATGETLRTFEPHTDAQIENKLARAAAPKKAWRRAPFSERKRLMLAAVDILENEKAQFGRLMTTEMGKPVKAARDEAVKCAWGLRYYAENAETLLRDEPIATESGTTYISYQPIGAVLAVMPWNFPFWQVLRFAGPALMAGNVALLKHSSNVPQCALAIEDIFRRAGFPDGAFQTLLIGSEQVARVIDDPRIAAVTLTGSEAAGRKVASQAGGQIKKTVLELGGSDPFIVMPSADVPAAAATAVKARTINNGQSCIASKRFIVADAIADDFERRFVEGMAALKIGDPMDESMDVGPLATAQVLEDLDQQVQKSVALGARVLTGGKRLDRPGNYYAPTVLTDIPPNAPAYSEEMFGPVASLFRVPDREAAIRMANDSTFGLGSSVWTRDDQDRDAFIRDIEAGQVFVNGMTASDPRLPFGGVKASGYGRELSVYGIREFVNIKTVCIKTSV